MAKAPTPVVPTPSNNLKESESTPIFSMVLRFYWMGAGHLAIGLCGLMILKGEFHPRLLLHVCYFAAALMCIAARYIDIRVYKGFTAEYKPATMAHWRRYSLIVAVYSIAFWTAIHFLF